MTRKEDLPPDASPEGGYLVMPRRIALGGFATLLLALAGSATSFVVSDARQDDLIRHLGVEVAELKAARAENQKAREDMRVEAGRMQEKLSSMEALIRETRDLMREMSRQRRD